MANNHCCVCNAPNSTLCSVCQSAAYCSEKCKQDDARTHNLLCEAFATFDKSMRPTKSAILALYFPILPYNKKGLAAPEMIWIDPEHKMHTAQKKSDGTIKFDDPLKYDAVEAYCIAKDGGNTSSPVEGLVQEIAINYLAKFDLNHNIVSYMREGFDITGCRPNITLVEVAREDLRTFFTGPLVVYSKNLPESDVTLSDFRTFLDFCKVSHPSGGNLIKALRSHNLVELELTNPTLFHDLLLHNSNHKTFKGVEITCEGDKKFYHTEQFLSVNVPLVHPVFDNINNDLNFIAEFGATAVSKMIELPLIVRHILPDNSWPTSAANCRNETAEYFKLNTDIRDPKWGTRDPGTSDRSALIYGRVLVVRKDKVDLSAHQVEAIAEYFKKVFERLARGRVARLRGLSAARLQQERRMLMDEHISRTKFEAFFKEFKEAKIRGGDTSWTNEVLPYQVGANTNSLVAAQVDLESFEKSLTSLNLNSETKPKE